MEQYIVWYKLQLKAWTKRKTSWMQLLGMVLLVVLIAQIHLPNAENTEIGICAGKDAYAGNVVRRLKTKQSVFTFRTYLEEEALWQDIVSGKIECGFVFADDFEARVKSSNLKKAVAYICTPFTAKGAVAQETVYAAFFELYSETILQEHALELYGKEDQKLKEELLEKNRYLLEHSDMFQVEIKEIDSIPAAEGRTKGRTKGETQPIQGMVGLFVFLMLWMTHGRKFESSGNAIMRALDIRQRHIFEYLGYLAAGTIPALAGTGMLLLSGASRGAGKEMLYMLLFVAVSSLWVLLVGKCFRNSTTFVAWVFTILLMQMLLCPILIDLSEYVPAVAYVNKIFPLGWYLL